MHSYRYLGLQFSASGSFTLARANLYNKGLKAYFKLVKDILSYQPSVNTSMHIFDHTVKPVLLYGSEILGALNPSSPRLRNDVSLDKIYQNIDPDKLNTKFCKFTLWVNRKKLKLCRICRNGKMPLLAHLSRRLIGELIVYQWSGVRRPSVRPSSVVVHNAQRSSSPKPLGRSKPNFMWSLLG